MGVRSTPPDPSHPSHNPSPEYPENTVQWRERRGDERTICTYPILPLIPVTVHDLNCVISLHTYVTSSVDTVAST